MPVAEAAAVLSQLAQSLVEATLHLAQTDIRHRHGLLPGPELAVIAYGSLGACALGFDSDLDLIFLYQPTKELSDGARPMAAERYHTGVARRMLSFLSATTSSGRLYSIDARLRPNGRSGLLVSSEEAFKRYQLEQAWVWELQALTRARPVAGDKTTMETFAATRKLALTTSRDNHQVKQEVREMRQRLRAERDDNTSFKYGRGGLVDIQFVVQLGLLLNAGEFPDILKSTELTVQLQALHQCGWINDAALSILVKAHEQLSQWLQRQSLIDDGDSLDRADLLSTAHALCDEILG